MNRQLLRLFYNVNKNTGLRHMGNTIMNAATMLDDSGIGRMVDTVDLLENRIKVMEDHMANLLELE